MDLYATFDDEGGVFSVIGEIKNTDWDTVKLENIRRRVNTYIRQVWRYISASQAADEVVFPSVIFPKRPKSIVRLVMIERLFDEKLIAVIWDDEPIEVRKVRGAVGLAYPR